MFGRNVSKDVLQWINFLTGNVLGMSGVGIFFEGGDNRRLYCMADISVKRLISTQELLRNVQWGNVLEVVWRILLGTCAGES